LLWVIIALRDKTQDDIVIYTGYTKEELEQKRHRVDEGVGSSMQPVLETLRHYKNIIIKYGRYISNGTPRFDEILGRTLVSNNQYAEYLN
jgi:hypothetical protein